MFSGNTVDIDGKQIVLDFPVLDAFREGGRVFVLFDPDAAGEDFRNLICIDLNGTRIWEAELPEPGRQDVYYRISSKQPLVANSFSSYKVQLDPETGRILGKEFVK